MLRDGPTDKWNVSNPKEVFLFQKMKQNFTQAPNKVNASFSVRCLILDCFDIIVVITANSVHFHLFCGHVC